MRITKVKVNNSNVEIVRDDKRAILRLGDRTINSEDEIIKFLKESKKNNIIASVLNTTIKNKKDCKVDNYDEFKKTFEEILKIAFFKKDFDFRNKKIDIKILKSLLKEKIIQQLNKFLKKEKNIENNSIEDIDDSIEILKIYNNWAKVFFESKINKISKSISNNTTSINTSPRGKVFEYFKDNPSKFDEFKELDFLNDLIKKINDAFDNYNFKEEETNFFKLNCDIKEYYKDYFWKFIRDNKEKLQDCKINKEHILRQYIIEFGKYLDLYFPVKKSGKKQNIKNCKYLLQEKIIKETVKEKFKNAFNLYELKNKNTNDLKSDDLIFKKIKENFILKFSVACGFSANNLKSIINKFHNLGFDEDIIFKQNLETTYKDITNYKDGIKKELEIFFKSSDKYNFDSIISKDRLKTDRLKTFLLAIRDSIREIRNTCFDLYYSSFDQKKVDNFLCSLKDTGHIPKIAPIFRTEIDMIPELIIEKIKTAGLFDYYSEEELNLILPSYSFAPKAIYFSPGFKKTFKNGIKYQIKSDNHLGTIIYNDLNSAYIDSDKGEARQANYNALMYVYEQIFINKFLSEENKKEFYEIKNLVIKSNIEQNSGKNKYKFAFKEIQDFKDDTLSPIEYLKKIQSFLLIEESRKRSCDDSKEGVLAEDETGNYQKFIEQLFVKGFDTFIQEEKYDFLIREKNLKKDEEEKKKTEGALLNTITNKRLKTIFDENNNNSLAFWIFCKMLDHKNLNELKNQISKFIQASEKKNSSTNKDILTNYQDIISLCLLTNDKKFINNGDLKLLKKTIEPYIISDKNGVTLNKLMDEKYLQSDKETPIIFSHLEKIKKYTTKHILEKVIEDTNNAKISYSDFDNFKNMSKDINEKVLNRERLHKEWVVEKRLTKGQNTKNKDTDKIKKYKELCEYISKFDWLNNKIHFVHIKKIHDLLMDILGRFASYAAMSGRNIDKSKRDESKMNEIITKRNFLAHFNYIESKNLSKYSILDLVKETREILSFDRKLKNSVVKSLITILDRHGIKITFKELHSNNHNFEIDKIESKYTSHLKGKVRIEQHQKEYIDMVKTLLELK